MRVIAIAAFWTLSLLAARSAMADQALDHAIATWAASGPDSYVYSYQKYCECHRDRPPETFVAVGDNVVRDVYHVHPDSDRHVPARDGSLPLYWTVPDLFSLIRAAETSGVSYEAEYDATLGYPVRVYIDYDADV